MGAYWKLRDELAQDAASDWRLPKDQLGARQVARERKQEELGQVLDFALSKPGGGPPRSARALRAPGPGELFLLFFPVPGGWAGFARDEKELRARSLASLEAGARPETIAARLLEPFRGLIERNRRLAKWSAGGLEG